MGEGNVSHEIVKHGVSPHEKSQKTVPKKPAHVDPEDTDERPPTGIVHLPKCFLGERAMIQRYIGHASIAPAMKKECKV